MRPSTVKSRAKNCGFQVTTMTEPCGWWNYPAIPSLFQPSLYLRLSRKAETRIHSSSRISRPLAASDSVLLRARQLCLVHDPSHHPNKQQSSSDGTGLREIVAMDHRCNGVGRENTTVQLLSNPNLNHSG